MIDNRLPRRTSIRLRAFDYAQHGAYFVTVCSHQRECLFGEVSGQTMQMNEAGSIVAGTWDCLPDHYPHVETDALIVMPNHVHAIIMLTDGVVAGPVGTGSTPGRDGEGVSVAAGSKPAPTIRHGLPEIVRAFKTFSARRINDYRGTPGQPVWQRNYHEHVIRDEASLNRIRRYIAENPATWDADPDNVTV